MTETFSTIGLKYIPRVAVFLLVGPVAWSIGLEAMAIWRTISTLSAELPWQQVLLAINPPTILLSIVIDIFGAYVLGWKALLAAGLVMGLLSPLVRWYPISLLLALVVGGIAGAWLIGSGLKITHNGPDWASAELCALASFCSVWVMYRDRFLRPGLVRDNS